MRGMGRASMMAHGDLNLGWNAAGRLHLDMAASLGVLGRQECICEHGLKNSSGLLIASYIWLDI